MKKENIFIIVVIFAVILFFAFIWFHEHDLQISAKNEIADCARVVSTAVWNYEDDLPIEYLSLTGRKNNFNSISILMREGGTFIELNNLMTDPLDKFFINLDFTYHVTLVNEINYNGAVIGYIKAEWYPLAIYTNLIFLVFLSLCLVILWYQLKNKDAANSLEKKVTERTLELTTANAELENEISKRKAVEKELIKSKEKSEELNKLKSSLLTNLSHEIRTPMNGILGFASILTEKLKEPAYIDMSQKIYRSGQRLMNTLGAILDLSELESNTMEIKPVNYDIAANINSMLKQYKDAAEDKHLHFKIEIRNDNKCALIDEHICRQIITKVVDNAVKYTETGGIIITVYHEETDWRKWIIVDVCDTGIGIADVDKEIIFEEFKQLSEGFSRNYEGTGLGLTLVKKMLHLSNGQLELESRLGYGSSFKIKFPAAEALLPKEDSAADLHGDYGLQSRYDFTFNSNRNEMPSALLVEDNPINSEVTEIFLKGLCKVDGAQNGDKAIEMAKLKHYSLILMDINLGSGIDGVQTAKEIKKLPGYENVPFVALTGYAMSADKNNFLSEGFSHYLAKPFNKEDLIELVAGIFSKVELKKK